MFWILLTLIFTRPFVAAAAFPYANLVINCAIFFSLFAWFITNRGPRLNDTLTIMRIPLLLCVIGLVLTTIFTTCTIKSYSELFQYVLGLALFLFGASLENKKKECILTGIIWAGVIISLLAFYQYFWGFRHVLAYISKYGITDPSSAEYLARKRVFFPFLTPNILGGYLAMVIPLVCTRNNRKIIFLIPFFFALILTASVGAFISLGIGLSAYYLLTNWLNKRTFIILAGFFLTGAALIITMRFMTQAHHRQPSFSALMRISYWTDTLKIIAASPVIGAGPGNFFITRSHFSHNAVLQIWAELGILTLIGFLWLTVQTFAASIKNILDKHAPSAHAAITAACFVFCIHNLVDFSFFLPEVSFIWWVLLGMLVLKPGTRPLSA